MTNTETTAPTAEFLRARMGEVSTRRRGLPLGCADLHSSLSREFHELADRRAALLSAGPPSFSHDPADAVACELAFFRRYGSLSRFAPRRVADAQATAEMYAYESSC